MCTFNIALNDRLVYKARSSFPDDKSLTMWIEEQITALLLSYVSEQKEGSKSVEHAQDMSVFSCFSGEFGGNRDAHEIAEELH